MKLFKRMLCLVLSLLMVFSVTSVAGAENEAVTPSDEITGFTQEDFLTTKGQKIVNQKGEEIQLKGVNLGAWLVREDWLNPDHIPAEVLAEKKYDGEMVYDKLEERFGREKAHELMTMFYENWITEWDLDNIKSLGFNCVRVPFWYRNFYFDDNGTKILDENGEWDFSILDWVIEECGKRELYVILDMHGAVGSQSDAPHSGRAFAGYQLYEKSERGERYRELTKELWTAIAGRYNGNPTVAMYDLLNEPMCDVECGEITRRINNEWMYGLLYDTVRNVDVDHIITMECIWTALALPHAFTKGWDNVVYQVHFYNNSDFIFTFFCLLTKIWHFDVPMMMGEFYPHGTTTWENSFETMNNLDFSWMLWTYKATGHGMWSSDWCLYGAKDGFWRADIYNGTYEEIAEAWSAERLNTQTGFQDTGHFETNVERFLGE
ncbi:MAG: cellulase family glycosylhydrolase [Clostridia bacterium]|nr:cellulase family glycosylhydrolase [Clostridia bacterium]